jgi:dUTPase
MRNTFEVYFEKVREDAIIPKKATDKASCYDINAVVIEQPAPDEVICRTGLKMLPASSDVGIVLVPRSGITNSSWIQQNSPGQGDPDYVGEYLYKFRAIPIGARLVLPQSIDGNEYPRIEFIYADFPYVSGDRIGQIYLREVFEIDFIEKKMPETGRGEGGFNSTGKKPL